MFYQFSIYVGIIYMNNSIFLSERKINRFFLISWVIAKLMDFLCLYYLPNLYCHRLDVTQG